MSLGLLASGTRIGPYEIVASLGAGAMGEVHRAREATHQTVVGTVESASDRGIPHSYQSQRARRLLAEDVTRGRRRDALTSEQDDAARALGEESGKVSA